MHEDGLILLERGVEIAFLSLIPKDKRIHTVGNLNNPFGVALDTNGHSVFVSNCDSSNVLRYSL